MAVTYAIRTKDQHIEALQEENKNLRQQVRDLLLLNEPGFFVDLKGVVNILHQKVLLISQAESSVFYLYNRTRESYELSINRGVSPQTIQEIDDYIQNDPDKCLRDEANQFTIPSGFLILPLSRRHRPLGLIGLKLNKRAPENIIELLPLLTHSAGIGLDNAFMYEKMLQKLLALSNVFILGKEIVSTLDIKDLVKKFLGLCCDAAGVEIAALYLVDPKTGEVESPVILDRDLNEHEVNRSSGVVTKAIKKVLETLTPLRLDQIDSEEYGDEPFHFKGLQQKSMICFPVMVRQELVGLVQFANKLEGKITSEDVDLLKILINQIAYVLQNSRLYLDLHKAYQQTAEAFGSAVDQNFQNRSNHATNVAALCRVFAKSLKLTPDQSRNLQLAAYLHDIGKLGLPPELLNKHDLNDSDKKIIEQHVQRGVQFIQGVDYLKPILEIISHHHELFDGSGYPKGLKGEEIPYLARILTLVDCFEAMTHPRPYRNEGMTLKKAYDELIFQSGKQFDPELVKKFIDIIEEGHIEILEN